MPLSETAVAVREVLTRAKRPLTLLEIVDRLRRKARLPALSEGDFERHRHLCEMNRVDDMLTERAQTMIELGYTATDVVRALREIHARETLRQWGKVRSEPVPAWEVA